MYPSGVLLPDTKEERDRRYERLKALPPDMAAELERREAQLIAQGADDAQLAGLQRLFIRDMELRGL